MSSQLEKQQAVAQMNLYVASLIIPKQTIDKPFSAGHAVLKNRTKNHMLSLFSGLITSKTRIKILMRLFLNPNGAAYLRELADDFQASPSQVKDELDQLHKAKLLVTNKNGRHVLFSANREHPLFNELQSMVKKALGMDEIIESIVKRLGNLQQALLIDDYAEGKDTGIIDLVLIGDIDTTNLLDLTAKTERYIERKIRTLTLTTDEYAKNATILDNRPKFILWEKKSADCPIPPVALTLRRSLKTA